MGSTTVFHFKSNSFSFKRIFFVNVILICCFNEKIAEAQVSALIESVSGSVDKAKLSALATALKGKDLNKVRAFIFK